jgi:ABC-type multidrug transport system fused ATPase/permease subunit
MFSLAGVGTASQSGATSWMMALFQRATRSLGVEPTLGDVLISLLMIFLLQSMITILNERLIHSTRFQCAGNLRIGLFEAILSARYEFISAQKTGALINALTQDPVRTAVSVLNLVALAREATAVLIYVTLALMFSWQMTLVALGITGVGVWLLQSRVARGHVFGTETVQANTVIHETAVEMLSCAKLVKGFGVIAQAADRFRRAVQTLVDVQVRDSTSRTMVGALYQPLTAFFLLAGLYLSLSVFKMSVPDIMVLLVVFFRLTPRVSDLQMVLHELMSHLPSVANIDQVTLQATRQREQDEGQPYRGLQRGIELRGVWFRYGDQEPILRGVDLELRKGEMIAIVGTSGGGKTTVVDLVMGFLRPTRGEVLVDGVPLHRLSLSDWHARIGYVPQDVNLFNDTVRANLLWGKPDATSEEIESVAKQVYAHEFILSLPQGYDTVIGSRGVLLSGGQRQRLALARALIRRPEVLVLDEATSALDAESEFFIQQTLDGLARNITIVMVAHRLATIQRADRIYVLEHGRIVESGSWEGLVVENGRFNELRKLQALESG